MSPIIVYVTRPPSSEIYMGGDRSVLMWVNEPMYSHRSTPGIFLDGIPRYSDMGWTHPHQQYGVVMKPILKQDNDLREAVWKEVLLSVFPKGMSYEEGCIWMDTINGNPKNPLDVNYKLVHKDDEWEAKCNTCHKRFLLKVDVRAGSVERIMPKWTLDGRGGDKTTMWKIFHSDEITPEKAVECFHPSDDLTDDILL